MSVITDRDLWRFINVKIAAETAVLFYEHHQRILGSDHK